MVGGVFSSMIFQPTRPLRGATYVGYYRLINGAISTHAPLAGRDDDDRIIIDNIGNFNPRAPCGARPPLPRASRWLGYFNPRAPCGARLVPLFRRITTCRFQPTRPLRGATSIYSFSIIPTLFQPTRPLRGATRLLLRPLPIWILFQPTRPLRGATGRAKWYTIPKSVFQPTRPLRGATIDNYCKNPYKLISTHAPLAGRDIRRPEKAAYQ